MAGKNYSHDYRHRSPRPRHEDAEPNAWAPPDLASIWFGLPWMNLYLRTWTRWMEQLSQSAVRERKARELNDDRRRDAVPWMPQFEATVIPLRRSTDRPGSEAARLSMRVSMPSLPWAPGTDNVISIDTLLPRPTADADKETDERNDTPGREPISKR